MKLINGCQGVIGEILLLYGRALDLYRNGTYATLSEGNDKNNHNNYNEFRGPYSSLQAA